jgi:rubrerythrin
VRGQAGAAGWTGERSVARRGVRVPGAASVWDVDADRAKRELLRGLQLAYSGEWGAIRAYLGHRASLPAGEDRALIRRVLVDEIRHRRVVLEILTRLGGEPDARSERKLNCVGAAIAAFCRVGGRLLPMAGAARLERDNIVEYEVLARLAWWANLHDLVEPMLHLAEVEWDHEAWLRASARKRPLGRLATAWAPPPPRASIRERFADFVRAPTEVTRRKSLLVR